MLTYRPTHEATLGGGGGGGGGVLNSMSLAAVSLWRLLAIVPVEQGVEA